MITARDVIKAAVERTDLALRGTFQKNKPFMLFTSGKSVTIENEVSNLSKSRVSTPFPLVAMFTEGVTETQHNQYVEFRIPKLAIVIRTKDGTDEHQKMEVSFRNILHVIYEEFARQLQSVHFGYELLITHSDLPCFTDREGTVSLNQVCDAVVIRNLTMRVLNETC
jgi:hypothetical protein